MKRSAENPIENRKSFIFESNFGSYLIAQLSQAD